MNPQLLIDAIVRQTTVLIAQLSTAVGVRAPLAHIADQVFLELAREIEAQGVSRKVAADMFGLALRTYQLKVQRLEESNTERDRTLWEGVLAFVEEAGEVTRQDLASHFEKDDPVSLGAVVNDLVQSGFLERASSRRGPTLRVAPPESRRASLDALSEESRSALLWVTIYRGAKSEAELAATLGLDDKKIAESLALLAMDGRVKRSHDGTLHTTGVSIPVGAEQGWEAAIFDHYQAMISAICKKLDRGKLRSAHEDVLGGATLTFELSADHPLRDEVRSLLKRTRSEVNDLWRRVGEHNEKNPIEDAALESVCFYFGQSTNGGDE